MLSTSDPTSTLPAAQNTTHEPASVHLTTYRLTPSQLTALTPELRDQLLDYLLNWNEVADLTTVVEYLREAHGPLLFLLDYQAQAALAQGDAVRALETIERRQRRSTTVASQALEARALLAGGHPAHALAVAEDIAATHPRHIEAVRAAAEIFAAQGDFPRARQILETCRSHRPGEFALDLALARLAYAAGDLDLCRQLVQTFGVPATIADRDLAPLADLHQALDNRQSAQAVQLEIARRRAIQSAALVNALRPYLDHDLTQDGDPAALYRQLSGPESIPISRDERRTIQLEAARHFGFIKLREGQSETIAAVLRGESVLAVMPTGAGKSLCYQLPALIFPKPTLVVSPLIALMKDQLESLPAAARRQATFINSTLTDAEQEARLRGILAGDYKLIFVAPERLRQRGFLRILRRAGLALFVVDEAHCVSLWGHDFRPDYLFIQEARRELGDPPALAITATAPPRVRDEIVDYIGRDGTSTAEGDNRARSRPTVMALDIFRNNLHLSALQFHNEDEKLTALLKFVRETDGAGIVYVNSRHKAESVAFALRDAGVEAEAYHAGMDQRSAIQDRFMAGKTRVVVATIAFGMGIDKADIRFIVHFHPSRSLAAYYQEVGRAGRDGNPSQGVLFYSNNDWANLRRWAKSDEYNVDLLERVYAAVATQLGIHSDVGDTRATDAPSVLGPVEIRRLQQVLNQDETAVRVAVSMLERADLLTRGFDVPQEIVIRLPRRLSAAAKQDADFLYLLKGLALGPGQDASFKTQGIADFMEWPLHEVESRLLDWESAGYLTLKAGRRAMLIDLPPRPADMRARLERLLSQSATIAQRRIDDVVGYATTETCRHGYISAHFGSPPRLRCTVCDCCTGIRPDLPRGDAPSHNVPDDVDVEPMIIDCLISLPKPVGRSGLARILAGSLRAPVTPDKARHHGRLKALGEAAVTAIIDDLIEDNRLRQYERQGYPVLAPTLRGRAQAEAWLAEHPDLAALGEPPPPVEQTAENEPEAEKYTALQRALWGWRRRSADEQGQPTYMIMSNELMLRIAESRPQTLDELALLPGMGAQRMEHYGPTILDLVHLHPAEPGDDELLAAQRANLPTVRRAAPKPATAPVPPQTVRRIYMKLQELRQKLAVTQREKSHLIAANTLIKTIAQTAPSDRSQLDELPGFRQSGLAAHADQIVALIVAARADS